MARVAPSDNTLHGENTQHSLQNMNEVEQALAGHELRNSLNQLLQTLSVLSALLSAWGLAIYVTPAADCKCLGETGKLIALVAEWVSLGMFFLTVCCSVAVMIDVEGVPSVILGYHLENRYNQIIHSIPIMSLVGGILGLAISFAFDLGCRVGCWGLVFGGIAAPGFLGSVIGVAWFLKKQRAKCFAEHRALVKGFGDGKHMWFSTWKERIANQDENSAQKDVEEGVGVCREGNSDLDIQSTWG